MKKVYIPIFMLIVFMVGLSSCAGPEDQIIKSLGKYQRYDFYSEGAFQDFTDYAKYYYTTARVDENQHFSRVEDFDCELLNECLDDFESWIKTYKENDSSREIVVNYDFNRSWIDSDDYIHIDYEKHEFDDGEMMLCSYDIYFFDMQTNILYFFHNNI